MTPSCLIKKNGFTLIELLVVVGIIGIITTIGVASYNNFNDRRLLDKAVQELRTNLRLVQSKAVNNEKDPTCLYCQEGVLNQWVVNFNRPPWPLNTYQCRCNGNDCPNTHELVDLDIDNDGNPDIDLSYNNSTIFFDALGGTSLAVDEVITLTYDSIGVGITVYKSGDVQ